jgi:hypothetical protein
MEAVVTLAMALKSFSFEMIPDFDPGMTTGIAGQAEHMNFCLVYSLSRSC